MEPSNSQKVIEFYSQRRAYGFMSNFWKQEIHVNGQKYNTSEHYFQAAKFFTTDPGYVETIKDCVLPGAAAKKGRSRSHPLREDWEGIKDDVMYVAITAKFTQHEDLKQQLLDTGDAYLVEHTKIDHYWADGGDGSGKNMLGILLMRL